MEVWSYPIQTLRGPLLFSTLRPTEANSEDDATALLSPREREVFHYLAAGQSTLQIADAVGIAVGTVKNHLSRVYRKLGAKGRAETVYWAAKHGYIR